MYPKQKKSSRSKLGCATLLHNKPRCIVCNLSKNKNCGSSLGGFVTRRALLPQYEIRLLLQDNFSMNLISGMVSLLNKGTMERSLSQNRKLISSSLQSTSLIIRSILCFPQVLIALFIAAHSRVTLK